MTLYTCDFEYDGVRLSDLGYIVCEFGGSSGDERVNAGSEITFITVPLHSGKRTAVAGSKYDKCLSAKLQICKNPNKFNESEMEISDEEFRALSRWLNRREYLWFHGFDADRSTRPWFRASFSLTRIDVGKTTYGVELDMVTDSPFGYDREKNIELEFTSTQLSKRFSDDNDEIGDTYPEMTITCNASGDLKLENDVTGCSMEINNCVSGEIITLSGESLIISTSSATHSNTIANDFNYDFFRFGNSFENCVNTVTASIPCDVVMRYRPILKDTL